MIVDRNSWHYKLYRFAKWRAEEIDPFKRRMEKAENSTINFCEYFNRAITMNVLYAIFILVCLALIGMGIFMALSAGVYFLAGLAYLITVLSLFAAALAVVGTIVVGFGKVGSMVLQKEAPDNIFVEKVRSWKDKVCPVVEVK